MLIRRLCISDVLSRKNYNLDTKKEPQPTPNGYRLRLILYMCFGIC